MASHERIRERPPLKAVYLASPYGSSEQQKALPSPLVRALEGVGAGGVGAFARNNQIDRAEPDWAGASGRRTFGTCESRMPSSRS